MTKPTTELCAELRALKAKQDAGLAALATRLDLILPTDFDPYYAIGLDIGRLQHTERLWSQACDIARAHCPVDIGLSHVRDGIPALAKRAESAELGCERLRVELMQVRSTMEQTQARLADAYQERNAALAEAAQYKAERDEARSAIASVLDYHNRGWLLIMDGNSPRMIAELRAALARKDGGK